MARETIASKFEANARKGGGGGKNPPPPEPEPEPTYSAVYVVGDSLVDGGNILKLAEFYDSLPFTALPEGTPTAEAGYYEGRFSNGYVYTDLLANKYTGTPTEPVFPYGYDDPFLGLGIPIAPWEPDPSGNALNFAYGGAKIRRGSEFASHLDEQTDALKDAVDKNFDPDALIIVTMGGNDVRALAKAVQDIVPVADAEAKLRKAANKLLEELTQLKTQANAQTIVLTGIPDVGGIPAYDLNLNGILDGAPGSGTEGDGTTTTEWDRAQAASEYSAYLDDLIRTEVLPVLEARGVNVIYIPLADITAPDGSVIEQGALNQVLPTIAALNGLGTQELQDNLLQYRDLVYFDHVHPTAQVHALVGSLIFAQLEGSEWIEIMPLSASEVSFSAAGTIGVAGEADTHTVYLARGETYTIEVLGMSTLGISGAISDPSLAVFDQRGKLVTSFEAQSGNDSGLGFDASFTFTAARSGNYSIVVRGEGSLVGDYVLQVGQSTPALASAVLMESTELFGAAGREWTGLERTTLEFETMAVIGERFYGWETAMPQIA